MACINMFNNEQPQGFYNTMGPRISFSNDFSESQHPIKLENSYREAPVSADFAFSAPSYNMISADELFFKGKILPSSENSSKTTTLRDELLAGHDDDYKGVSKGTSRWKEMLGLKRSHIVPIKADKTKERALESIDEMKTPHVNCDNIFANFKGDLISSDPLSQFRVPQKQVK